MNAAGTHVKMVAVVKTWSTISIASVLMAGRVRHATHVKASVTPVLVPTQASAMTMETPSAALVCLAGVDARATRVSLLTSGIYHKRMLV